MFDLMPFGHRDRSMFDSFFGFDDAFFKDMGKSLAECKTDIIDQGDRFVLQAELPGYSKEDVHIDLDGDMLTIHAEHSEEKTDEQKTYIRRERRYGGYSRRFDISGIRTEEIAANYKDGVLELVLPKKDQQKLPQNRRIEIGG